MIIREHLTDDAIKKIASESDGMVKVVADIKRGVLSLGCEFHIDCAEELREDGAVYENLWGANVYFKDKRIDFVSLINIRPAAGNRSMEIKDVAVKACVESVIKKLLF